MRRSLSILFTLALIALALPVLGEEIAIEPEIAVETAAAGALPTEATIEPAAPSELPGFDLEALMTPDPDAVGGCAYKSWCDLYNCGATGLVRWCERQTDCSVNCSSCGIIC